MDNLSVLICGIKYPPETFLDRLIKGLSCNIIDITVACDQRPGNNWLTSKRIHWLWTPDWNVSSLEQFLNFLKLCRYIPNWNFRKLLQLITNTEKQKNSWGEAKRLYKHFPLGSLNCNIVYFPWVLAADMYIDFFVQNNIPIVVSLRGAMVNINPIIPRNKEHVSETLARVFSAASAVHCVSQDILDEAIQYGLDPAKAMVIRPAVDPYFFIPPLEKITNKRLTIITTGSLIWRKGYEYALVALRWLVDSGVEAELHIIGEGPDRQRIIYTTVDLSLEDRVILHGKQSPSKVRDRLQQADIFLLSSLSEGISNAVLEAMACGVPVVTTDCGGMREAITDGVEGFVVPVRDPRAMAGALSELASNPQLRQQMGQSARRRIFQQFSLEDQIASFTSLFEKVIKEKELNG